MCRKIFQFNDPLVFNEVWEWLGLTPYKFSVEEDKLLLYIWGEESILGVSKALSEVYNNNEFREVAQ